MRLNIGSLANKSFEEAMQLLEAIEETDSLNISVRCIIGCIIQYELYCITYELQVNLNL